MMEETSETQDQTELTTWNRRPLVTFICGSIVIAILLVLVSMALYASSGAAQLDLSRPGFKSVQNKVNRSDTFESFPATGSVDAATIDQFLELYKKQVRPVNNTDAFSPDALDPAALDIDAPITTY
jgi:hypothetical protein